MKKLAFIIAAVVTAGSFSLIPNIASARSGVGGMHAGGMGVGGMHAGSSGMHSGFGAVHPGFSGRFPPGNAFGVREHFGNKFPPGRAIGLREHFGNRFPPGVGLQRLRGFPPGRGFGTTSGNVIRQATFTSGFTRSGFTSSAFFRHRHHFRRNAFFFGVGFAGSSCWVWTPWGWQWACGPDWWY